MLFSYWNSAPQICLIAKLCKKKTRIPKFGTKNAFFGYFWARILKKAIVIFEINTHKFVKNESLTHTVNFGIGSAFSKGPGSTFSEGSVWSGSGFAFKVWL